MEGEITQLDSEGIKIYVRKGSQCLVGKPFGLWVVLSRSETKYKVPHWLCRCGGCGIEIDVSHKNLMSGATTKCRQCAHKLAKGWRPLKYKVEIGQRFGMLVTEKQAAIAYKNKRQPAFECRCDCGGMAVISQIRLLMGLAKACGCRSKQKRGKHNRWQGHGEISLTYFNRLIRGAIVRNFEFLITIEQAWQIAVNQGFVCALTGVKMTFPSRATDYSATASFDRIDSSKGYIEGNCQWIRKQINQMKMDFPENEFIEYCRQVAEFASNKSSPMPIAA